MVLEGVGERCNSRLTWGSVSSQGRSGCGGKSEQLPLVGACPPSQPGTTGPSFPALLPQGSCLNGPVPWTDSQPAVGIHASQDLPHGPSPVSWWFILPPLSPAIPALVVKGTLSISFLAVSGTMSSLDVVCTRTGENK